MCKTSFVLMTMLTTLAVGCASSQPSQMAQNETMERYRYAGPQGAAPSEAQQQSQDEGMTISQSDAANCYASRQYGQVCPVHGVPLLSVPAVRASAEPQTFAAQAYRKDVPECYSGSQMVPCEPPGSVPAVAEDSPPSLDGGAPILP